MRVSADSRMIVVTAVSALQAMYRRGFSYAKAGVKLVDLRPRGQRQGELDLFTTGEDLSATAGAAPSRLMEVGETLNRRYARGALTLASAQLQSRPAQHGGMQERGSPRCTTRLDEIVTARA